jgi:hypothetical protein
VMRTPSAQTLDDMGVREMFQGLEDVPMAIVGGLDVHRQQITFDYVDDDGLMHWGQIRPATRKTLRDWQAERCGLPGWMSPSTPRMANAHRGIWRQGSPELRWAAFEVAKCAARVLGLRLLPVASGHTRRPQRQEPDPGGGAKDPAPLLSHAAAARRCRSGAARPRTRRGSRLAMSCARALPVHQLHDVLSGGTR